MPSPAGRGQGGGARHVDSTLLYSCSQLSIQLSGGAGAAQQVADALMETKSRMLIVEGTRTRWAARATTWRSLSVEPTPYFPAHLARLSARPDPGAGSARAPHHENRTAEDGRITGRVEIIVEGKYKAGSSHEPTVDERIGNDENPTYLALLGAVLVAGCETSESKHRPACRRRGCAARGSNARRGDAPQATKDYAYALRADFVTDMQTTWPRSVVRLQQISDKSMARGARPGEPRPSSSRARENSELIRPDREARNPPRQPGAR